jgi:hypothetical protein
MPPDDGHMTEKFCGITSEEEKRNCCVDKPLIVYLVMMGV